jgi:GntR family histidine utilization transcriptional repressor
MTANRAVRELTSEGVLVRIQGKGTFVKEPKPVATLLEIKPIAEEITQKGGVHSSRLHTLEMVRAQGELALAMNLTPGDHIYHVVLVHMNNGTPVQLEDRYVNPLVAPGFMEQDFTHITPSRYLLDVAPLTEVEHVVEALMPDANTQDLLYLKGPEPCLVLYRRTWSHEKVATRSKFVHPGTRFSLGGRFKPSSQTRPLEA